MIKQIGFLVAGLALALTVGCSGDNGQPGSDGGGNPPDLAQSGVDSGGGNPDMAFVCVTNPMTNDDFLNSCAPASVDKVDVMPFYPSLAPGGVLPALP